MRDTEKIVLGLRAMACKGWRWLPGMATLDGWRFVMEAAGSVWVNDVYVVSMAYRPGFPDFEDAATIGCLLQLLRESTGNEHNYAFSYVTAPDKVWMWSVAEWPFFPTACASRTEAEALVAALELAAKMPEVAK